MIKNHSFKFAKITIFVLLIIQILALFLRNYINVDDSFSIINIISKLWDVHFWAELNNNIFRLVMTSSLACAMVVNIFMLICLLLKDSVVFSTVGSVFFLLFASIYALFLGVSTTNVGFYNAIRSFNMVYFVTLFLSTIIAAKIKTNSFYKNNNKIKDEKKQNETKI